MAGYMLGEAMEQIDGVGQDRERGLKGGDGSDGAAGDIQDDGDAEGSAEGAAEGGERSFAQAGGAHQLGDAVEEAVADGAGGLRGNVAGSDAGAPGGNDEIGGSGGAAEGILDGGAIVGDDDADNGLKTGGFEGAREGGAGEILAESAGAGVAHGDDGRGLAVRICAKDHVPDCKVPWKNRIGEKIV